MSQSDDGKISGWTVIGTPTSRPTVSDIAG
jgi:hypothetical protein